LSTDPREAALAAFVRDDVAVAHWLAGWRSVHDTCSDEHKLACIPCRLLALFDDREAQLAAYTEQFSRTAAARLQEKVEALEAQLAELRKPCGWCSGSGCFDCSPGLVKAKLAEVEAQLAEAIRDKELAEHAAICERETCAEAIRDLEAAESQLQAATKLLLQAQRIAHTRCSPEETLQDHDGFCAELRALLSTLPEQKC